MLKAGALNRRITLQQPQSGHDSLGQPSTGWTDVATLWASIRYGTGAEAIRADAQTTAAQVSIRIRQRADVTPAMRVVFGGVTYSVRAVLPDLQRGTHLDLVCEEIS